MYVDYKSALLHARERFTPAEVTYIGETAVGDDEQRIQRSRYQPSEDLTSSFLGLLWGLIHSSH